MKYPGIICKRLVTFLAWIMPLGLPAQTAVDTSALATLNATLSAWQSDNDLAHAAWGFCLLDPKTGKMLGAYNPGLSLMPASGMKVVTTLSALTLLGPDYRYPTTIEYDGTIGKDSVLNGNLYIHGSGDPTLGSGRMEGDPRFDTLVAQWAQQILQKGIRKITGYIIADASAFDDIPMPGSWNWDDIGQYYGAGTYGLNVYENSYNLFFSSSRYSTKIDSIFPDIDGMQVVNHVTAEGYHDDAYIFGAPGDYARDVRGTIPAYRKAYIVSGSMPDPPFFLARALEQALRQAGISTGRQATTLLALHNAGISLPVKRNILVTHYSAPLSDIIFETNQHSINLYAETLLKTIAHMQGDGASDDSGTAAVRRLWESKGINLDGYAQEDGSGLSRLDLVTPDFMCSLLAWEMQQENFPVFFGSLPVSGQSGTLKTITRSTAAEGMIHAKSGSMMRVRSYSGYVMTKSGDPLVFSVIVNNYTCPAAAIKTKLEKLMIAMAGL